MREGGGGGVGGGVGGWGRRLAPYCFIRYQPGELHSASGFRAMRAALAVISWGQLSLVYVSEQGVHSIRNRRQPGDTRLARTLRCPCI